MEEVTELVAIRHAYLRPEAMVMVYTDFQAALKVQQQPHHSDNVWLVTYILRSVQCLIAQRSMSGCTGSPAT